MSHYGCLFCGERLSNMVHLLWWCSNVHLVWNVKQLPKAREQKETICFIGSWDRKVVFSPKVALAICTVTLRKALSATRYVTVTGFTQIYGTMSMCPSRTAELTAQSLKRKRSLACICSPKEDTECGITGKRTLKFLRRACCYSELAKKQNISSSRFKLHVPSTVMCFL